MDANNYRGETVDTSSPERMGYAVEIKKCSGPYEIAYFLTGKRGAIYGMIRHRSRPELMYVVNRNGVITSIKGNYTWTDKDGKLTPFYA